MKKIPFQESSFSKYTVGDVVRIQFLFFFVFLVTAFAHGQSTVHQHQISQLQITFKINNTEQLK